MFADIYLLSTKAAETQKKRRRKIREESISKKNLERCLFSLLLLLLAMSNCCYRISIYLDSSWFMP